MQLVQVEATASNTLTSATSFDLLGVKILGIAAEDLTNEICTLARDRKHAVIGNVNAHAMNFSYELPWFRSFLNQTHLTYCDGFGVLLAARLCGTPLKRTHRAAIADFFFDLIKRLVAQQSKIFLLGGTSEHVAGLLATLKMQFPNSTIEGHHGYFDHTGDENKQLITRMQKFAPTVVLVAFGMPLQEAWISKNHTEFEFGVFIPVGACFDFAGGFVRRPPQWMTNNGLEWLGRLCKEPRRMWHRYLVGLPVFFWRVFLWRARSTKV